MSPALSRSRRRRPSERRRQHRRSRVYPLDELGRLTLTAKGAGRCVVTDDTAGMFAAVHGDVLTAPNDARTAPTPDTDLLLNQPCPARSFTRSVTCRWRIRERRRALAELRCRVPIAVISDDDVGQVLSVL